MLLRLALLAAVSASALAQPAPSVQAPDVIGTWELESAEALPVDDALVFARLAFTEDTIRGLYVFLDPDDGELSGRRTRARYRMSDGQLIVRENNGVTVWEVTRVATGLMIRDLETGAILRMRQSDPGLAIDRDLLGVWTGLRRGEPFAVRFRPDGTADVGDPDKPDRGRWDAAGAYLVLGDDPARYAFARDAAGRRQLVVDADGEQTVLTRTGE